MFYSSCVAKNLPWFQIGIKTCKAKNEAKFTDIQTKIINEIYLCLWCNCKPGLALSVKIITKPTRTPTKVSK